MALVFFLQFCSSISLQTEQLLNLLMRVVRKDPMGWDNAVLPGKLIGALGDRSLNQARSKPKCNILWGKMWHGKKLQTIEY